MSTSDLKARQLALAVQRNDAATFGDFCWSGNELLQQQLLPILSHPVERVWYIWGEAGCGKSHLLQAYCHAMTQTQQSACYLPLHILNTWDPAILEGMVAYHLVAIDDMDCIAGQSGWEEALFHLYNRLAETQSRLLISAHQPPAGMGIGLADLGSRLSAGLVIQLHALRDQDKVATLQMRAQQRGFELSAAVSHFIIRHCARSMHDLNSILNQLDEASLVAQRKVTIPFVKDILGI